MVGDSLGWLEGGFKLDMFLDSNPLSSNGPFLGYFLMTEGFIDNSSRLFFVGGNEMSILVVVE